MATLSTLLGTVSPAASATVTAINPYPVGTVLHYAGTTAPNGWLLCEGQAISLASYPNLYALIGGTVPDLRSRFLVGTGQGTGLSSYTQDDTGGEESITLNVSQMPSHQHYGMGESYSNWPYGQYSPSGTSNNKGSHGGKDNDDWFYGTTSTGGGEAHENRPPFFALTYIIKY